MSTVPTLHELDEAQAGESTLFDSLPRLVPEELQTAYYRVLAHTRTLSPDDGRDSPLKYTVTASSSSMFMLGMAGIHRSSTLPRRPLP